MKSHASATLVPDCVEGSGHCRRLVETEGISSNGGSLQGTPVNAACCSKGADSETRGNMGLTVTHIYRKMYHI